MKTPIQELIEEVTKEYNQSTDVNFREGLDFVINAIKQDYLQKEKEVIMEAHQDGAYHTEWNEDNDVIENAQDYYNQTFNTKNK